MTTKIETALTKILPQWALKFLVAIGRRYDFRPKTAQEFRRLQLVLSVMIVLSVVLIVVIEIALRF